MTDKIYLIEWKDRFSSHWILDRALLFVALENAQEYVIHRQKLTTTKFRVVEFKRND